jgi:hypothetical protein
MTEPSPRPWRLVKDAFFDSNNQYIGDTSTSHFLTSPVQEIDLANSAHIVHCVNAYDRLVEFLDGMCGLADCQDAFTDEDSTAYLVKACEFLEELKQ